MSGWVKLHRTICDNDLWLSESFTWAQAWIDILLNANHTEGVFYVRKQPVTIARGQLGWSELTMAKRWRWSRGKVRRYLKMLDERNMISQQKTCLTTIISIHNYDKFQEKNANPGPSWEQNGNEKNGTPEKPGKPAKNKGLQEVKDSNGTPDGTANEQQTVHKQECKECKEKKQVQKDDFERLWKTFKTDFGRKGPKTTANDQFKKTFKDQPCIACLITTVQRQIENKQSAQEQGLFFENFPHVHRWLRDHRWEDEIESSEEDDQEPWHKTGPGVEEKAKALGVVQEAGELFPNFRDRVYAAAGHAP